MKDLFEGLDQMLCHYNKDGIMISTIHANNEFKSMLAEVKDFWDIAMNFSAPDNRQTYARHRKGE